jgi:hypothetical protein
MCDKNFRDLYSCLWLQTCNRVIDNMLENGTLIEQTKRMQYN